MKKVKVQVTEEQLNVLKETVKKEKKAKNVLKEKFKNFGK